jgi:hypothetical protein
MKALIERSSLGSPDARRARASVPAAKGRAVARSAMTGRHTDSARSVRKK